MSVSECVCVCARVCVCVCKEATWIYLEYRMSKKGDRCLIRSFSLQVIQSNTTKKAGHAACMTINMFSKNWSRASRYDYTLFN